MEGNGPEINFTLVTIDTNGTEGKNTGIVDGVGAEKGRTSEETRGIEKEVQ